MFGGKILDLFTTVRQSFCLGEQRRQE